jgi:hypothetical protein
MMGAESAGVTADVRSHDFARRYDLWHDRAVFHFMVDPADRDRYLDTLRQTVRAGGNVILATPGPEGPSRCSGLPVSRYDVTGLPRPLDAQRTAADDRSAQRSPIMG